MEASKPPGVFHVRTTVEDRPVAGTDVVVAIPPPELWVDVGGERALHLRRFSRVLRGESEDHARKLGEVLHHADWYLTADPVFVEENGVHGDPPCTRCRAAIDQVLAWMADHPDEEVLIGILYWAGDA